MFLRAKRYEEAGRIAVGFNEDAMEATADLNDDDISVLAWDIPFEGQTDSDGKVFKG